MEMGAADYITKPFDDIELLNAIEIRLKKIEILKKEFSSNPEGVNDFLSEAKNSGKIRFSLNENREIQLFSKKQLIYKEGHYPRYLYLVHKGKVKTYKINDSGKELITAIYKEGDFMGFTALYEGTVYHDNAEALMDSELMVVPKDEFIASISSDLEIARKFIQLLTKDITEKEEQLMGIAYNSLRKRVADGLLMVHEKFKKAPTDKPPLEISREDLAQVIGVAKESLIRTLGDFKAENLIEIKDGKILILKEPELKNLPN
jgi:CRP-like cAMP-binding protein